MTNGSTAYIGSNGTTLRGLATDPSSGNLYSSRFYGGGLVRVNPQNGAVTVIGGTSYVYADLTFTPAGKLYGVTTQASGDSDRIYEINPTTGVATFRAWFSPYGPGLAADPSGNLLATHWSGSIYSVNPQNGGVSYFGQRGSTSGNTQSIEFGCDGDLYFGMHPGWYGGYIHRVSATSPFQVKSTIATYLNIRGLAFAQCNEAPVASFTFGSDPVFHCTSLDGATSSVSINVFDPDHNPLTVTWKVNDVTVLSHTLDAGATSDTLVNYPFGFAPSTLTVSVTDGIAAPVNLKTKVTVADHDQPAPDATSLPTITGECSASIDKTPTATDDCDSGDLPGSITGTTTDPLSYTAQGTYTVTWTYTDPHAPFKTTTQEQIVIVKDITPPTISCPPDVSVAFGSVPAAATTPDEFIAQGGTISDNCDPYGTVTSEEWEEGSCPIIVTRAYTVTDAVGNKSFCAQIITVNNLFAEDGILWLQPLARNGASSDTDPGAGGTLKYRFKLGSTIPIKVQAQGCDGNVSANANVGGTIVVFGDTDMDGVVDSGELPIDYNGVGEAGGVMDKVDGKLQFNLDTKKLVQTFKCYILQVTVTDSSTGESRVETLALQVK